MSTGNTQPASQTPRSQMSELIQLIREKLIREPDSPSGLHAKQQSGTSIGSNNSSSGTGSKPRPMSTLCWLCAKETQSQFQCVDNQPLCLGCFQICYTATLRPQLLGDSQGYELAERLSAAESFQSPIKLAEDALSSGLYLSSSVAPDHLNGTVSMGATLNGQQASLMGSQTLAEIGSWRCYRCTFNNPNFLAYCEVCDAGSPKEVKCNHCDISCSNVNASPMRSAINRGTSRSSFHGQPQGQQQQAAAMPAGYPAPPPQTPSTPVGPAGARSWCTAYNMEHEVWECEKCTFVNTLACRNCTMCQTSRMWTCGRCQYEKNTSRFGSKGDRHCTRCGTVYRKPKPTGPPPSQQPTKQTKPADDMLSDSVMRRMGLDPEEARRERERTERLDQNKARLLNRLKSLGLSREIQMGDGNCQFRSLSHQLFGTPDHHMLLRHLVMLHIWKERSFYEMLFDNEAEFTRYWRTMSTSGTWGDEITLRAAADTFGVHLHVITSDEQRWHLHFAPENAEPTEIVEDSPTHPSDSGFAKLSHKKESHLPHLFLLYLAPVHYDDIVRPARLPNFAATLTAILTKLKADEADWDDTTENPAKKRSMNNDVEWVEVTPQTSAQTFGLASPKGIPATSNTFQGPNGEVVMVNHGSGSQPGANPSQPQGKIKIKLTNPNSQQNLADK